MGADIHSFAEFKKEGKWYKIPDFIKFSDNSNEPFGNRSYGVFGFLADVRNYSEVPIILQQLKGFPNDSEYLNSESKYEPEKTRKQDIDDYYDFHSKSWLSLKELKDFDYTKTFEDKRYCEDGNYGATRQDGMGKVVTFEEFLGSSFFEDILILSKLGKPEDVRIIYWFDN